MKVLTSSMRSPLSSILLLFLLPLTALGTSPSQVFLFEDQEEPRPSPYSPTWDSLDSRPIPSWYDEVKIGIFLHWGVFSVPSFGNEWFWYNWATKGEATVEFMRDNYPPRFTYQDFGPQLTAEFYEPEKWAELFERAGAKYVVLTSKHHEGYTLWPSKYSFGWNVGDVGPKRDLLGDLANAVRNRSGLRFGVYHSWLEFFNPLYLRDKAGGYKTDTFVVQKSYPELIELVENYSPELIWSDGDWEGSPEYWRSKEFLAWLYNSSPVRESVVVNDRWGIGTSCKHGGFFSCQDHYNPGHLVPYKWENAMTVDKGSWGFRRNAALSDYREPSELVRELVSTVSCGGNFLLNVGPTKEGTISPILQERLLQMGQWLGVNGDAIYGSRPWKAQNDSDAPGVWYTSKGPSTVYAIIVEEGWPGNGQLELGSFKVGDNVGAVKMLGVEGELSWSQQGGTGMLSVSLPNIPPTSQLRWGWTLAIKLT